MRNSLHILFRNEVTGKIDPKIYNVIEDEVTINPSFQPKPFFVNDSSTPFKEIKIVDFERALSPEILDATKTHRDMPMSEEQFFKGIIEHLKEAIKELWSVDKHHLIQHSSGFDSRIMGTIIRQIYEEQGDKWLGDISFVAWGSEASPAKSIVAAEGWGSAPFHVLPKNNDYFRGAFDFSYAWRGLNGASGYPVNHPDWAFRSLVKKGVIPDDPTKTQVWSASWFNEMIKVAMGNLGLKEHFLKFYYNSRYALFGAAYDFEFVQPLFSPRSVEHFTRAKISLEGKEDDVRLRLVYYVNEELAKLPRLDVAPAPLPSRYFERAKADYRSSWYGKKRQTNPTNMVCQHPWWAQWSMASLCEHLIEVGVKIRT